MTPKQRGAVRIQAAELEQHADRTVASIAVMQREAFRLYARAAALRLISDPEAQGV